MANERLRSALVARDETPASLAQALSVDPKTVERWIKGVRPHRQRRFAIATHLGRDVSYLWPELGESDEQAGVSKSELLTVFAHRWAVPRETWTRLFKSAQEVVDIFVIDDLSLAQDAGLVTLLQRKAERGVAIRLLVADPMSEELAAMEEEQGIVGVLGSRIRNTLKLLEPLTRSDDVALRLHGTRLYNSVYRADGEMLVNSHINGFPGSQGPVLHLRRVYGGQMVSTYQASFEQVWATAQEA